MTQPSRKSTTKMYILARADEMEACKAKKAAMAAYARSLAE